MEEKLGPIWAFVVKKVTVAVLLVIAGVVTNFVIEWTKADWTYKTELANIRTANTSEVWVAASKFEAQATLLVRKAAEAIMAGGDKEKLLALKPLEEESKRSAEALRNVADKNRFFLGKRGYSRIMEFHNATMDYVEAMANLDLDALKKAEARIEKNRVSLGDFADLYM